MHLCKWITAHAEIARIIEGLVNLSYERIAVKLLHICQESLCRIAIQQLKHSVVNLQFLIILDGHQFVVKERMVAQSQCLLLVRGIHVIGIHGLEHTAHLDIVALVHRIAIAKVIEHDAVLHLREFLFNLTDELHIGICIFHLFCSIEEPLGRQRLLYAPTHQFVHILAEIKLVVVGL